MARLKVGGFASVVHGHPLHKRLNGAVVKVIAMYDRWEYIDEACSWIDFLGVTHKSDAGIDCTDGVIQNKYLIPWDDLQEPDVIKYSKPVTAIT